MITYYMLELKDLIIFYFLKKVRVSNKGLTLH